MTDARTDPPKADPHMTPAQRSAASKKGWRSRKKMAAMREPIELRCDCGAVRRNGKADCLNCHAVNMRKRRSVGEHVKRMRPVPASPASQAFRCSETTDGERA